MYVVYNKMIFIHSIDSWINLYELAQNMIISISSSIMNRHIV